jgi:hypothetical protein
LVARLIPAEGVGSDSVEALETWVLWALGVGARDGGGGENGAIPFIKSAYLLISTLDLSSAGGKLQGSGLLTAEWRIAGPTSSDLGTCVFWHEKNVSWQLLKPLIISGRELHHIWMIFMNGNSLHIRHSCKYSRSFWYDLCHSAW